MILSSVTDRLFGSGRLDADEERRQHLTFRACLLVALLNSCCANGDVGLRGRDIVHLSFAEAALTLRFMAHIDNLEFAQQHQSRSAT